MSLLNEIKTLVRFKDLQKIQRGSWDGKPIDIASYDVDVFADRVTVECAFKFDGQDYTVTAKHPIKDVGNEITINGNAVEQDDVDLDFDVYPFKNKVVLEYRLEYTQDGKPHELVLSAWSRLL